MASDAEITEYVQRFARTRALAALAVRQNPSDIKALFGAGVAYRLTGDYASALVQFERAVAVQPHNHLAMFELASVQAFLGRFADAAQTYARVLTLAPGYYKARYALVQIGKQTRERNAISELEAMFPGPDPDGWRTLHIGHALAKAYEDLGDLPRSFEWLGKAKRHRKGLRRFDLAQLKLDSEAARNSTARLANTNSGHVSDEPIFIVGMPRTGTTLVERILSSHPDVTSAGEISNFSQLFKRMSGTKSPGTMDAGTLLSGGNVDFARLGKCYIDSTRPLTGMTARFIDKAPSNYMMAGLILKALPRARIVCVRRHPLDTCLSNYRQIFPMDDRYFDYVYDLRNVAHQYIQFDGVARHWRDTLPPNRFVELSYEALVSNQEPETKALLAFCELGWDPRCLAFHENSAGVATPSAMQVRQAMYSSASGRWMKYGALLDGARTVLKDAGIALN